MSDIDIAVVDSLKVLDPRRPIREADIIRCTRACRGSLSDLAVVQMGTISGNTGTPMSRRPSRQRAAL